MAELEELETQHPGLVTPDSPTQRVGLPPSKEAFQLAGHQFPMLSLRNISSHQELLEFDKSVKKLLGTLV